MRYFSIILAVLLLASCSVKKRTYRSGYYIDWAFQNKKTAPVKQTEDKVAQTQEQIPLEIVSAKSSNEQLLLLSGKNILLLDTCGDLITFKSGDQVRAKVIEISDDKIKYKRCDNLDGPTFVVNKSNVALIRYVNGVEEKIETPAAVYTPPTTTQPQQPRDTRTVQKVQPYAWWALASVILLWWLGIGFILGLIFSTLAIKKINQDPKRWSGLKLSRIIQRICIIFIGLIIVGLLLSM
jgi:hypothetical protein